MLRIRNISNKTLASDTSGAVAVVFGLVAVVLMLAAGGAVDYGRWFYAHRATANALDAAVLAGARTLQLNPGDTAAAINAAKSVYTANIQRRLEVTSDTVSFATANSNTAVTATGNAYIATPFMKFAGVTELPLVSQAGAQAAMQVGGRGGASNLELSIMLDVTGSMCDDGTGPCTGGIKMNGLKDAANHLVNIITSSDQSQHTSKVAVVPFSTRVRVGPNGGGGDMMKRLTNLDPTWTGWYYDCTASTGGGGSEIDIPWNCTYYDPTHMVNWKVMPCVTDRTYAGGGFDATDIAPGNSSWLNAHDGTRRPLSFDGGEVPMPQNAANEVNDHHRLPGTNHDGDGNSKAQHSSHWNYELDGGCSDVAEANEIQPLTNDKAALTAKINSLEAFGATGGAMATSWVWYLLSPLWDNIWTGSAKPAPYSDLTTLQPNGAPKLRKVAVLMTDGGYNTIRGWKGQDQQMVSNHAIQVCNNMKAKGIEVYTVGFALNELLPGEKLIAENTLRACGTDLQHFFNTLTVPELKSAFNSIGASLTSLVLSK
jgi:Flp pilus assembly protein TadG